MFANRDWSPAPNLTTVSGKVAAENMLRANWITQELVGRTAIPRPALAIQFKISIDAVHTTPTTLINAFAARIYTLVHHRYRVSARPAAASTKAVNAQAVTNPVPAAKLPAPHPAPGVEQQNTALARPAAPTPARPARNPSPVPAVRTKSKSQQPNAERPVTNAKQSQALHPEDPEHHVLQASTEASTTDSVAMMSEATVVVSPNVTITLEPEIQTLTAANSTTRTAAKSNPHVNAAEEHSIIRAAETMAMIQDFPVNFKPAPNTKKAASSEETAFSNDKFPPAAPQS